MGKQHEPVGPQPKALTVHKEQTLDVNEIAHALKENAEHTLKELDEAIEYGLTHARLRHIRAHVALAALLADRQCSIVKWAWVSLVQIEGLVARYRLQLQLARISGIGGEIKVTAKKRAACQSGPEERIATSS